jgi:NAD(P)-dependent dehydrogenase (short-subunit alcohol dehydrogenase family)
MTAGENGGKSALILGVSSGFGEAVAIELARRGYDIYGVHLDRRETMPHVEQVARAIAAAGRAAIFFNGNAADDAKRAEVLERIRAGGAEIRVLLHSLAFGALKPLAAGADTASRKQLEMTADVMGHSLVYWARDLVAQGAMRRHGRIYAMTSEGGTKAVPSYGPSARPKRSSKRTFASWRWSWRRSASPPTRSWPA